MNLRKQLSSYIALNNYVEAIRSSQLLAGYTELEYIESTGTQYINTGVVLGQDYTNTNIKLEYDALINSSTHWQVCGTVGTDGIYIGVNPSNIIYYGTGFNDTSTGVTNPFVKCKYINDAKNGVIKVTNLSTNTDIVNLTRTPVTKTTVLPMILFGFSRSATVIDLNKMSGKMYNAKIYNNNELIRHFIPAKRNSDNVLGMYDAISGTFFTNSGTGNFVAGPVYNSSIVLTDAITNGLTDLQLKGSEVKNKPEVFLDSVVAKGGTEQRKLPVGYTTLEYLESTGTQYIDTNILIQSEYQRVVSKFSADGMDSTLRCFGSQDTAGNCTIVPWPAAAQSYPWGYLAVGTSWYAPNGQDNPIVTALNTVYEIDVTANNGILTGTYCGETISTTYAGTLCNNLSITLFGNKRSSTNIQKSSSAKVRIYYYKLYTAENVLTANYIPAKRNSDNVLGMYDKVSGAFLTNVGTGEFVAGPEVVPTPDTPIDITSNNGVLKVSPNLFDKNASYALFTGYINNVSVGENTTLMAYGGGDKTIIIKVAPNTTYTVTRVTNLGSVYDRIRCAAFTALPVHNSTGVILCNYMNNQQANATFTTLSDTQYVAINVRNSGAVGDDWTQFVDAFQLEQGSTATQYRPYGQIYTDGTVETIKDSLNNTATTEMLLKVGDYQDEQEILSGTVMRNIGIKVLDGTEDWGTAYSGFYSMALSNHIASVPAYCNYFQSVITGTIPPAGERENKVWLGSSWLGLGATTRFPTVEQFKQWLADQYAAGTPVIVIYPLNASTTETVSPQKLLKNPVTVTEASIDNLEVTTTEAEHTVPTPDYPLDIVCNNGVLKVGPNNDVIVEGTPETVTVTGKNLYDVTKDTTGKFIGANGSIGNDSYSCYSGLIPVKEGESYTYSGVCGIGAVTANNKRIHGYVNGIWNQQITVITINENTPFYATFTIPTGINGIRISHWYKDENTQVEEGIRPTKYEEYYQASFAPEDLLKLGNYQDVQNVLDGIVMRNIGIKVLDGTEPWTASSTYLGSCYTQIIGQTPSGQVICSHFQNASSLGNYSRGKCHKESSAFNLWYGDNRTTAIADLKQFLADQYAAGTPVIVVYPLANTVEETIESRDVFITSGTNTVERNSEYVSSDGITVKYKKLR